MYDELLKLGTSLLIGTLLGLEREFRNKPAGLRTIVLICTGATIFTLLSVSLGAPGSPDRIASNIITGIGFIGAGVIFKMGTTVVGLTTAATIWIAAALGTAVGAGDYILAWTGLIMVLFILTVFERIQSRIQIYYRQMRMYTVVTESIADMLQIEKEMQQYKLLFKRLKEKRSPDSLLFQYEVTGLEEHLLKLDEFLLHEKRVKEFEY